MTIALTTRACVQNQQQINLWKEFPLVERTGVVFSIVFVVFGVICSIVGMVLGSITTGVIGFSIYIISILSLLRGVVVYNHFSSNYLVYGSLDTNYQQREFWGNICECPNHVLCS
ncbi:hypothetical protein SBV42_00425 [Chlamydia crocodili]|uniref:Transmembrane protein n=2 Tax=Chlamydia crocodili TaxID=2766982 RepID=A0ABX8CDZ4_9CHLA|nr:hypothetical protein [Chlamydia crocodili]QVE49235.1 hypothetical protein H9Q19_00795 [Chlamydia crocodili]